MSLRVLQYALGLSLFLLGNARGADATDLAPASLQATLQGHFVYMKNCVFCHGRRGDGRGEMGLTVVPVPRDFGSGVFKYRSTPSGSLPTNDDLARTVREGIADTAMPTFANLPERDVQAVVEYVKTFSAKWRKPENHAAPLLIPKRPDWFEDPGQFSRHVGSGRQLYTVSCAPCHGSQGDGRGSVTNLLDSWGRATPARDLRRPYLRSGRSLEDIYKVLVTGLDGTPMPSYAESTKEEDRWNLVAFIEQLRRDERKRTRE